MQDNKDVKIKKKRKKGLVPFLMKVGFFTVFFLLGWTVIIPYIAALVIYNSVFGSRVTPMCNTVTYDDYKDVMNRKRMDFYSGKNKIAAYLYTAKDGKKGKALVFVCHGIGCNMDGYLNRTQYFVRKGYDVFTFDMTGTCQSEGKNIYGLNQSKIDLHNAIEFVKSQSCFKGMPLLIYGHSWSGYASANVLNYGHDELAGVATLSGFNNTWDTMYFHAQRYVGKLAILYKPWEKLVELTKFGRDAGGTAVSGINKYHGPVLISHSKDDPTVPYFCSVIIHKDEITNPQAKYLLFEDRGHTMSRPRGLEKKISDDLLGKKTKLVKTSDYNIFQYNVDIRYEYSDKQTVFAVDDEFMDMIDAFFCDCLKKYEQKKQA